MLSRIETYTLIQLMQSAPSQPSGRFCDAVPDCPDCGPRTAIADPAVHIRSEMCRILSLFNGPIAPYDEFMAAGMVLGRYYRRVVTELLRAGAGVLDSSLDRSAPLEARIAALADAGEYPWPAFTADVASASEPIGHKQLVAVGKRIVAASKAEFERWGFESAEAILTDLDAPFGATIIDPPEHERMITAKYQPGYALFCAGAIHPAALVEGYVRGIVEMYGGTVGDLACHAVNMDGHPMHLIELRWSPAVRVTRRTRPASGPHIRRVA